MGQLLTNDLRGDNRCVVENCLQEVGDDKLVGVTEVNAICTEIDVYSVYEVECVDAIGAKYSKCGA